MSDLSDVVRVIHSLTLSAHVYRCTIPVLFSTVPPQVYRSCRGRHATLYRQDQVIIQTSECKAHLQLFTLTRGCSQSFLKMSVAQTGNELHRVCVQMSRLVVVQNTMCLAHLTERAGPCTKSPSQSLHGTRMALDCTAQACWMSDLHDNFTDTHRCISSMHG